jgi:hypothetical protein
LYTTGGTQYSCNSRPHYTTRWHPQAEARAAVAELLALRVFFEQLPSASDLQPTAGPQPQA